MIVKSLLLATGTVFVAGCAANGSVPPPGLHHPANPRAAAAPLLPLIGNVNVSPAERASPEKMHHEEDVGGSHGMHHEH